MRFEYHPSKIPVFIFPPFLVFFLLIASCQQNQPKSDSTDVASANMGEKENATGSPEGTGPLKAGLQVQDSGGDQAAGAISAVELAGVYFGMLPCPDCKRILLQLQLNVDQTFSASVHYHFKEEEPFRISGEYLTDGKGRIEVNLSDPGLRYFKKYNSGLMLLDPDGNEYTGPDTARYVMRDMRDVTSASVEESKVRVRKMKADWGFDFYGMGDYPQWNLDLDFDKQFRFITLTGFSLYAPPAEGITSPDGLVTTYETASESGELIVVVTKQPCTRITREIYDYRVEVKIKGPGEESYTYYDGCGNFVDIP